MNEERPNSTFFLTTAGEYDALSNPRECHYRARLSDAFRDDHMLVTIDPPLIGQAFGLGGRNIDPLILSTRHEGHTLFPVDEWPAYVYVARFLDDSALERRQFSQSDVELIAWGQIFRTFDEAVIAAKKSS